MNAVAVMPVNAETETDNTHPALEVDEKPALQILKQMAAVFSVAVEAVEATQLPDMKNGVDFYEEVKQFEIKLIQQALKETGGNQSKAAQLLGLKQTTLHGKIKQYKIYPKVLMFANESFDEDDESLIGLNEQSEVNWVE